MDCTLCGVPSTPEALAEAGWAEPAVVASLLEAHPDWKREDGACPACVQQVLLELLLARGESALHETIQRVWPLDAEAAFGALPTPLRLHADPRLSGRGVTLALVDAGFYPHPDLVEPVNRIRAWADASREPVEERFFAADAAPEWPGWDAGADWQWHGLMTSVVAAGNGRAGRGLYRGLASESEVVLVQVRDAEGRIRNGAIARALRWLRGHAAALRLGVVNLSLGGDAVPGLLGNEVDDEVARLVAARVAVVAASGNDGVRRLVPPGTAPEALTVGGLDDHSLLDHEQRRLWHANYGQTAGGALKPELVAPSLWVVAPVLPGSPLAQEAAILFARRARGEAAVEARLAEAKLVTPHYQHVEGTSFAAPVVASVVACMLQANPALPPRRVRELLLRACHPVPGASPERQGAGALDAGRATTLARGDHHGAQADFERTPQVDAEAVRFLLHDHEAHEVRVVGSWNEWDQAGLPAEAVEPGLWQAALPRPPAGVHGYKFLLDGTRWLTDPANPARMSDGQGGWNSVLSLR